jgi:DNA-directed RNA polymerase specialized sigma24 family protein
VLVRDVTQEAAILDATADAVETTRQDEFGEFMAARWPGLVRLAYGLTGDGWLAEDVAQAALAEPAELPDLAVADPADRIGQRSALLSALRELPRRQRAIVVLRYWEDLSDAQVAAALGCAEGTVRSQASRALAKLRGSAALADGVPERTAP